MIKTTSKEFKSVVKGENFMTPMVMSYWISGDYIAELSQGDGFDGSGIFGVTVVNGETMTHDHEKSMSFADHKEALDYIKSLGE